VHTCCALRSGLELAPISGMGQKLQRRQLQAAKPVGLRENQKAWLDTRRVLKQRGSMGRDRVYTLNDYYDGPRIGIADVDGVPHVYEAEFDHSSDEYGDTYFVSPVNESPSGPSPRGLGNLAAVGLGL
jgi:hypothetical protein